MTGYEPPGSRDNRVEVIAGATITLSTDTGHLNVTSQSLRSSCKRQWLDTALQGKGCSGRADDSG